MPKEYSGLSIEDEAGLRRRYFDNNPWRFEAKVDMCTHARRLGYDTIQLWDELCSINPARGACSLEIISCDAGCMSHRSRTNRQSCISGLELRTGADASIECRCNGSRGYINCINTAPHIEPPTSAVVPRPSLSAGGTHGSPRRTVGGGGPYERSWGAAAWLRELPSCAPGCTRDRLDWEIHMDRCHSAAECQRTPLSRMAHDGVFAAPSRPGSTAVPPKPHFSFC